MLFGVDKGVIRIIRVRHTFSTQNYSESTGIVGIEPGLSFWFSFQPQLGVVFLVGVNLLSKTHKMTPSQEISRG